MALKSDIESKRMFHPGVIVGFSPNHTEGTIELLRAKIEKGTTAVPSGDVTSLQLERDALKAQLAAVQKDAELSKAALTKYHQEIAASLTTGEAADVGTRIQQKNDIIRVLKEQLDEAESRYSSSQEINLQAETKIQAAVARKNELEEMNVRLRQLLQTRAAELEIANSSVDSLKAKFASAYDSGLVAQNVSSSMQKVEELRRALEDQTAETTRVTAERERLSEQLKQVRPVTSFF